MVHGTLKNRGMLHLVGALMQLRFCDIIIKSVVFWVHKHFGMHAA